MSTWNGSISGIWLPLITPFVDGQVDFASYERLPVSYTHLTLPTTPYV